MRKRGWKIARYAYLAGIFFTVFFGLILLRLAGAPLLVRCCFPVLVILPGYGTYFLMHDLRAATRLRKEKKYSQAVFRAERFLSQIKPLRWLKPLMRLPAGMARDPEELVLCCLGGSLTSLKDFEQARPPIEEALRRFPKAAFPYYERGVLLWQESRKAAAAKPWFEKSRARGFTSAIADKVIEDPAAADLIGYNTALNKWEEKGAPRTPAPAPAPGHVTVQLLNDDKTPMEFVVDTLGAIFGLSREAAVQVMLEVHRHGSGILGSFPVAEAEQKITLLHQKAEERGFPLRCVTIPHSG